MVVVVEEEEEEEEESMSLGLLRPAVRRCRTVHFTPWACGMCGEDSEGREEGRIGVAEGKRRDGEETSEEGKIERKED